MIGRAIGVPLVLAALILFIVIQGILRGFKVKKTHNQLEQQQEAARQKAHEQRLEIERKIKEMPKKPLKRKGKGVRDETPPPTEPDYPEF